MAAYIARSGDELLSIVHRCERSYQIWGRLCYLGGLEPADRSWRLGMTRSAPAGLVESNNDGQDIA